jgi:hypothetical protein
VKKLRCFPACIVYFLLVLVPVGLEAVDFTNGRVRLVIHEDTGRFSLYYLNDLSKDTFEPLFVDQDPRTSFVGLLMNDKTWRLGESSAFRFRLEEGGGDPALVFESSFLKATESFSFIKTAGSSLINGIKISITLENRSPQEVSLGLRFLVDTSLGEGPRGGSAPLFTDKRPIDSEALITAKDDDQWWISGNDRLSLMGSIRAGVGEGPDLVHIANWKRLNEAPWKANFLAGRNFNYLPYSIGDSAVCYYYEPRPVSRGETLGITILLAAEDTAGFADYYADSQDELSRYLKETVPLPEPATQDSKMADLILLQELINRIDRYVAGEIVMTAEDLEAMELVVARIKTRYNLP